MGNFFGNLFNGLSLNKEKLLLKNKTVGNIPLIKNLGFLDFLQHFQPHEKMLWIKNDFVRHGLEMQILLSIGKHILDNKKN